MTTRDDATTPTDHLVELPDGRTLALRATGPEEGPVVVLCHSAPGSRALDPDPAATAAAGVRLVTADRAGYGASTPVPAGTVPTIPGYADDLAAGLAHLGVTDAGVAGWSAGGRVALALAARHPALVRAVAIASTPAPHEDVPWIPEEQAAQAEALKGDPAGATATMTVALAGAGDDPDGAVAMVAAGPADEAALAADPARRDRLTAMLAEAFAPGPGGVAADIVSYTVAPWGFDPAAVGAPTTAFYGADDPIVSRAHGEWYVARVPAAELRIVPGIGHLVAMTAWGQMLEVVG
jgi:pimeloyl-ACP methyl ester carboxylesterase